MEPLTSLDPTSQTSAIRRGRAHVCYSESAYSRDRVRRGWDHADSRQQPDFDDAARVPSIRAIQCSLMSAPSAGAFRAPTILLETPEGPKTVYGIGAWSWCWDYADEA